MPYTDGGRFRAFLYHRYVVQTVWFKEAPSHRHAALQLTIAPGREHRVFTDEGEVRGEAVLLNGNVEHSVISDGKVIWTFWVEAESEVGQSLVTRVLGGKKHAILSPDLMNRVRPIFEDALALEAPSCAEMAAACDAIFATLVDVLPPDRALHPAIRKALRLVEEDLTQKISAAKISEAIGLSEGRFLRLFKEQMGTTFRAYIKWHRWRVAVHALANGQSVTEAAHAAGYHDAAHMVRVTREFVALNPSEVIHPGLDLHLCDHMVE
jgi:AraC-like DNA-binding protein